MRTNVVIDDQLMARAMEVAGTKTKRETIDVALRELVAREERKGILDLVGKVKWEGDLERSREGRRWNETAGERAPGESGRPSRP